MTWDEEHEDIRKRLVTLEGRLSLLSRNVAKSAEKGGFEIEKIPKLARAVQITNHRLDINKALLTVMMTAMKLMANELSTHLNKSGEKTVSLDKEVLASLTELSSTINSGAGLGDQPNPTPPEDRG